MCQLLASIVFIRPNATRSGHAKCKREQSWCIPSLPSLSFLRVHNFKLSLRDA